MDNIDNIFWENYAKRYDAITPTFQKHLLTHVGKQSFGHVGDFGCGVGKIFHEYEKNQNITSITGIDSSPQMLKIAKNKMLKYLTQIPTELINMRLDTENISNLKNNFDTINLINVLYANKNPIEILDLVSQKITSGGVLCIGDMNRNPNSKKLFQKMENEFKNHPEFNQFCKDNQELMTSQTRHTYSLSELETIISKLGDYKTIQKSEKFYLGSMNYLLTQKIK
jgi:2-polyprenyl-3-methyl-5-hydroxy-6-metoxy-1,4-benzoquinol methylase